MIKYCCLDMDGVTVDWMKGALKAHKISQSVDEFYRGHEGLPLIQEFIGISQEEFWAPFDEDFWANLDWMPDGQEILRMVEDRFGRENITICTSPSYNRGCWDGKRRWIERHMPKYYHKLEAQMYGSRKWKMANSETMLVDDMDSNVDKFKATRGGHVCHVARLWNRLHPFADKTVTEVHRTLFTL